MTGSAPVIDMWQQVVPGRTSILDRIRFIRNKARQKWQQLAHALCKSQEQLWHRVFCSGHAALLEVHEYAPPLAPALP